MSLRRLPAAAVSAGALLLAGCGGTASAPSAGAPARTGATAPSRSADAGSPVRIAYRAQRAGSTIAYRVALGRVAVPAGTARDRALAAHDHRDRITITTTRPVVAVRSGGPNDEVSATGATAQNPCKLVTAAEVRAIIHAPIARTVIGAQGPTCVYELARRHAYYTVSVQTATFIKVIAPLHHLVRVTIDRHRTACGMLGGATTLYAKLSGKQVLAVGAPCQVAAAMAAKALPRVRLIAGP